jgi:hypothetical protein
MGGYIVVGAICLALGCAVGVIVVALVAVDNNNEYHVEDLQRKEEREGGE